ncbi:MAG: NAD(P)-dependent oxidoreductase [Flavobacteriales bacterium]
MVILANDGISAAGLTALQAAGHTVFTEFVPAEDLAGFIEENRVECLLVRSATKVREPLISACPGLRYIGRGGVGTDNIDVAFAQDRGIVVFNTPAASSQSVAELVMAHLFGLARFLHDSNRRMPAASDAAAFNALKKAYGKGTELRGKTLTVIGFGRIGQTVARYALGSGMNVLAVDPNRFAAGDRSVAVDVPVGPHTVTVEVPLVSLAEALPATDAITVHVPAVGTPVLGAAEFAAMKAGVLVVNTARGGVVDEDALLAALDSGKVRAAALDVFVGEPAPREDVLAHPRISLTPHTGAATVEAQDRIGEELASIIAGFSVPA